MRYADPDVIAKDRLAVLLNSPTPVGGRIRVETEMPDNLAYTARLVVVHLGPGGGDAQLTLDVADVIADCYAGTSDLARDLAESVRAVMRLQVPRHTTSVGAFVTGVQTLARPTPAPSTVADLALWTATYRMTVHAAPGS